MLSPSVQADTGGQSVTDIALSPNGDLLALAHYTNAVSLWSFPSAAMLSSRVTAVDDVFDWNEWVVFASEAEVLGMTAASEFWLWNTESGTVRALGRCGGRVNTAMLSADRQSIFVATDLGQIVSWKWREGVPRVMHEIARPIECAAFFRNGKELIVGGEGCIERLTIDGLSRSERLAEVNGRVLSLSVSPNGRSMCGTYQGIGNQMHFWSDKIGSRGRLVHGCGDLMHKSGFSSDSRRVWASAVYDLNDLLVERVAIVIWDSESLQRRVELSAITERCSCAVMSSEGRIVAAGTDEGKLLVWTIDEVLR